MFKLSVTTRVVSFAVLIALLFASLPTAAGTAKTDSRGLEAKWSKLMDRYYRLSAAHNNAKLWVDQWRIENGGASRAKKTDLRKLLTTANAAWYSATLIAMRHNGFDAQGNVVNRAAAQQSVKDLARALDRYTVSTRSLRTLIRQFNREK